jgi:hypothetical protein
VFPLLAAIAVLGGSAIGGLYGWVGTQRGGVAPWLDQVTSAPLVLILIIGMLGVITNSWTIALLAGAITMVCVVLAREVAAWRWDSNYVVDAPGVLISLALVAVGGGALSLATCLWQHERRYVQALGAAVLIGALGWSGWRSLEPAGWPRDQHHLLAWASLAMAALVVLRCRGLGPLLLAIIGGVVVAITCDVFFEQQVIDLRTTMNDILTGLQRILRDIGL